MENQISIPDIPNDGKWHNIILIKHKSRIQKFVDCKCIYDTNPSFVKKI